MPKHAFSRGFLTAFVVSCFLTAVCSAPSAGVERNAANKQTDLSRRMQSPFRWQQLPPLPNELGLAGAFAGVTDESLVVAGGIQLGRPLDEGDSGILSAGIFALSREGPRWNEVGALTTPTAYGVSVTTEEGLICLGGATRGGHCADARMLRWAQGKIESVALPSLPRSIAFSCGALLAASGGKQVYVAGGLEQPESPVPLHTFWMLDLTAAPAEMRWQELEPWPGPARMLATVGVQDGSFFLMGGVDVSPFQPPQPPAADSPAALRDAYRYTPRHGWTRVADPPRPIVAAVTPAVALGQSHLLVLGGRPVPPSDPANLTEAESGQVLRPLVYHTITDTWIEADNSVAISAPGSARVAIPAMTTAVWWPDDKHLTLSGGEIGPGISTPQVLQGEFQHRTIGFRALGYGVLLLYLVVLVLLGCHFAGRASRSTGDFFLGGRRIPWWAAGISLFGTQISSITFMTVPGKTYATDWVYYTAVVTLVAVTPIIIRCYLPFYRRLNITTAYEYLEMRFNVAARLMGSASFLCFQLGRIGIVLYLPALSISSVTGINIFACIVLMGVLTAIYCLLGGIEAVIWTDVLQVTVMVGSALLCLILIFRDVEGGVGGAISMAASHGKLRWANWNWDIGGPALWVIVVGTFFGQFPQWTADQTYVQRYLTTSDEKQAARSVWTNTLLTIPSLILFFGLGTALWTYYRSHPHLLNPSCQTDAILPWFMAQQLPEGLAAMGMAGLIAAAMSSLDSSLNSMATTITTDFRRFNPAASDRQCLYLARGLTILLAILGTSLALYMALAQRTSMFDFYIRIVGLFGGSMAGLFVAGVFTRRTNGRGVLVGFFVSAVVLYFVQASGAVSFHLFSGIGIVTCVLVGWLVSAVFPGSNKNLSKLTIHTMKA